MALYEYQSEEHHNTSDTTVMGARINGVIIRTNEETACWIACADQLVLDSKLSRAPPDLGRTIHGLWTLLVVLSKVVMSAMKLPRTQDRILRQYYGGSRSGRFAPRVAMSGWRQEKPGPEISWSFCPDLVSLTYLEMSGVKRGRTRWWASAMSVVLWTVSTWGLSRPSKIFTTWSRCRWN